MACRECNTDHHDAASAHAYTALLGLSLRRSRIRPDARDALKTTFGGIAGASSSTIGVKHRGPADSLSHRMQAPGSATGGSYFPLNASVPHSPA